jgi:hypothetical protein
MAALYPVNAFAEVVALLVGAAHEYADLSLVKINRGDRGLWVMFETRTPQAFLGANRTRATALRDALAEKLGDPEVRLAVGYAPSDEARSYLPSGAVWGVAEGGSMTVGDLIDGLSNCAPDARVAFRDRDEVLHEVRFLESDGMIVLLSSAET